MSIKLPVEPAILCHFDSNIAHNYFKQPNHPALSDQIGLDTSKKIIGNSSKLLANFAILVFNAVGLTNQKDYTVSYYKYTTSIPGNLSGSGESDMIIGGPAMLYVNGSSSYCLKIVNGYNPRTYYTDITNIWAISSDLNKWVHVEFSFQVSTRVFRLFRNGILMASYTIPDLNGYFYPLAQIRETGNVQELLVIQSCLHTADFTPPTEPYLLGLALCYKR